MPFFIRKKVEAVMVTVHVVEAPTPEAAREMLLTQNNKLGYYKDDSGYPVGVISEVVQSLTGPFDTKDEAEKSDAAWVEDV